MLQDLNPRFTDAWQLFGGDGGWLARNAITGKLQEWKPAADYSCHCVFMNWSLEFMTWQDARKVFGRLTECLLPGGLMILKYHLAEDKLDGENEHLSMATGQVLRSKDLWLKLGEELRDYDLYATMHADLHADFDPQGMLIFRKRQN